MGGRLNLDGGTLNLDGGTLTLDGGTRLPYNLSTAHINKPRGQAFYPLRWPSLTKDLQTEPKKVLCVGVVRQMQSAWFIQTNNQQIKIIINFQGRAVVTLHPAFI